MIAVAPGAPKAAGGACCIQRPLPRVGGQRLRELHFASSFDRAWVMSATSAAPPRTRRASRRAKDAFAPRSARAPAQQRVSADHRAVPTTRLPFPRATRPAIRGREAGPILVHEPFAVPLFWLYRTE